MRERNSKGNLIRIVGSVIWAVCMSLSLIYTSNEYKSLLLTIFFVWAGFLVTSEQNRLFCVIQWAVGVGYVVYLLSIIAISSCNFIVLLLFSLVLMLIMGKRFKNEPNEDYLG